MDHYCGYFDLNIHAPACMAFTRYCNNGGPVRSDKDKYGGRCQRSHSMGPLSAHNCKTKGGTSYLCVRCGIAHCYPINAAFRAGLEKGQCFR